MKWIPLLFCIACATQDEAPISSTITLNDHTWTAAALSFDELGPQDVRIVLAQDVDRAECGWVAFGEVELSLLIGDRSTPHVVAPLDVTTPNSGRVVYTDANQDAHLAVSGRVVPGLTTWSYSQAEGHNVIVQIDGTFDVILDDGSSLGGAFSATPCY